MNFSQCMRDELKWLNSTLANAAVTWSIASLKTSRCITEEFSIRICLIISC